MYVRSKEHKKINHLSVSTNINSKFTSTTVKDNIIWAENTNSIGNKGNYSIYGRGN